MHASTKYRFNSGSPRPRRKYLISTNSLHALASGMITLADDRSGEIKIAVSPGRQL